MRNLIFALFGATGDLSYRKLIPAMYNLHRRGILKENVTILAIGRRDWTRETYIEEVRPWVKEFARLDFTDEAFDEFAQHIDYHRMEFTNMEDYLGLYSAFDTLAQESPEPLSYIFYYAVAPSFFDIITDGLTETGCIQQQCRVIIEKPFGDDLEKARDLADRLSKAYGEENVYHIDHYLGKEMVQNISTLRFRNEIFRGAWNQRHIDNVQISAFEEVGMEGRGAYYEENGALKDMVQNHMFQVFTIFAMEEPSDLNDDDSIHRAQTRVIEDLEPVTSENLQDSVCLAQYDGYHDEEDIPADSTTETYAAMRLQIKNERWRGVPIYIRTGKKLNRRETVLVVNFRQTHPEDPGNRLIFRIQPEEGVSLVFNIRKSGGDHGTDEVSMDFLQKSRPTWQNSPEAYERLLQAAYDGERGLFSPWAMITASWSWINDLIAAWEDAGRPLATYEPGSEGPAAAEELLAQHGHSWTETKVNNSESGNND